MARLGRNDPCPCGSGRKYKKCCLEEGAGPTNGEALASAAPMLQHGRSNASLARELDSQGLPLGPYAIARMLEDPQRKVEVPALRKVLEEHDRVGPTITRVAKMSTEAIEAQLRACGVTHSRRRFLGLTVGRHDAWSISEEWLAQDGVSCSSLDADFLGLAACELWKRWLPEVPSVQMLDDWMQDGYDHAAAGRSDEACHAWWRFWTVVRERFTPEMTTTLVTREAFVGTQYLLNWSQAFMTELQHARDARWPAIGVRFVREWIAQFPEEEPLVHLAMRRSLSNHLYRLKLTEQGRQCLLEIVERWPHDCTGYMELAETHLCAWSGQPLDKEKAREYLELGLQRVPESGEDRDCLLLSLEELETRELPEIPEGWEAP